MERLEQAEKIVKLERKLQQKEQKDSRMLHMLVNQPEAAKQMINKEWDAT